VQRNGFGESEYREGWDYADYVNDVRRVLDELGIANFRILVIFGGLGAGRARGFLRIFAQKFLQPCLCVLFE